MALTHVINGIELEMSPELEAETRARWKTYDDKIAYYEANLKYRDDRAAAYPSVGNQLDIILKHIASIENLDPEVQELVDIIAQIKSDYPKPQLT